MDWLIFVPVLLAAMAGAWIWGKYSDPKKGVVGCCHCGQCLVSGECVMRRKQQKKHKTAENE